MTSKDYLKQIAESKGVFPLTNEVKDNALLFPTGFEKIFQDLDRLEKLEAIENEFGIYLTTLLYVYKELCDQKFVYFKIGHQIKRFKYIYYLIDLKNKEIVCMEQEPDNWLAFKDYGITWALSKEVLENGL